MITQSVVQWSGNSQAWLSTELLNLTFYDLIFSAVNDNDMSDTASSCSGRSSCCSEASYHCTSWRGTLSTSWQSLASTNSTLMLPSGGGSGAGGAMSVSFGTSEDASSLSDASGISLNSRLGSCHFDRASNDKFSVEFWTIVIIIRECVRNLDLRVQVHPGEVWVSKQRVHIVL